MHVLRWSVSVHAASSLARRLSRAHTRPFLPSREHTHALSLPPAPSLSRSLSLPPPERRVCQHGHLNTFLAPL